MTGNGSGSVVVSVDHGIRKKGESNMRGTFAGLLTLGLVGSPLVAQVEAPPKPPANPPAATQPGQPPKPVKAPALSKDEPVKQLKKVTLHSFTSFDPGTVRDVWIALDDDDRIEIKDIKVREFFENIKAIGLFGTIVIKDNIKDEKMPETILLKRNLGDFINTLDRIADDFEVKYVESSAEVVVVSAKPKPAGKPNILFVPVNLEPLLVGIKGANEREIENNKMEKIKSIQIVIEQGIAFDAEARGVKPAVPLRMMVYPNNLLFLAGPPEKVEVAGKILSALGARFAPQDPIMGGWRAAPGGAGMGSMGMGGPPGMGGGGGAMGDTPGMTAPGGFGGPVGGGALGGPISGAGVPHSSKPKPLGGGGGLGGGSSPIKP